jgi:ankyrin repeat protein
MWASYQGHTQIVDYLLTCGANADAIDEHGISSLSWASGRNHVDIVTLLLRAGASPSLCDKNNTTPLIWASRRGMYKPSNSHYNISTILLGYTRIVDLLLKYNASVNNIGMKNMTALLAATKAGHGETVLRLLENRAIDIKVQDKVK